MHGKRSLSLQGCLPLIFHTIRLLFAVFHISQLLSSKPLVYGEHHCISYCSTPTLPHCCRVWQQEKARACGAEEPVESNRLLQDGKRSTSPFLSASNARLCHNSGHWRTSAVRVLNAALQVCCSCGAGWTAAGTACAGLVDTDADSTSTGEAVQLHDMVVFNEKYCRKGLGSKGASSAVCTICTSKFNLLWNFSRKASGHYVDLCPLHAPGFASAVWRHSRLVSGPDFAPFRSSSRSFRCRRCDIGS